MNSDGSVVLLSFLLMVTLIGFILNSAIFFSMVTEWLKRPPLKPYDQIYFTMALVNLSFLCTMCVIILWQFVPVLSSTFDASSYFYVILFFQFYYSYWLSAWLCVYYFTSIINPVQRFFAWLKRSFSEFAPKLILVSAVGSLTISLPAIWKLSPEKQNKTYENINSSHFAPDYYIDPVYQIISTSLGCFLPFVLSSLYPVYLLISSCLGCFIPFTLSSLCLGYTLMHILSHVCRIKFNSSGSARPNLQAHARAARTMIWIFLLSLSLHLAQAFQFVSSKVGGDISLLSSFLTLSFPAAQALIIIQSSAKLRQRFQFLGHFGNVCNEKAGLHRKS
uniref:Taste receptor type 2 n=1 Tax=Leptobrachium leishanense TaxID=445787 RepID=A0A8C5QD51_9ANUR